MIITSSPHPNRVAQRACNHADYKERHLMECFIGKLTYFRRNFARSDKNASRFLDFIPFASTTTWLKQSRQQNGKEAADDGEGDTRLFWRQLEAVGYEAKAGRGKALAWGGDATRLHDDPVLSAALRGEPDGVEWRPLVPKGTTRYSDSE